MLAFNTGVVQNVVSRVCRDCPNGARQAVARLFAIVCAGCREVVSYAEPYRERRTGFQWEAGKCYHVPSCPSCEGRVFAFSPVIEQKLFYKDRGFPYPDAGDEP